MQRTAETLVSTRFIQGEILTLRGGERKHLSWYEIYGKRRVPERAPRQGQVEREPIFRPTNFVGGVAKNHLRGFLCVCTCCLGFYDTRNQLWFWQLTNRSTGPVRERKKWKNNELEHTRSIDLSKLCIISGWYHSITNLFRYLIALSLLHETRIDGELFNGENKHYH